MNLDEIRELIRLMKENGLSEVDIESAGERVSLRAAAPTPLPSAVAPPLAPIAAPQAQPAGSAAAPQTAPAAATGEIKETGVIVRSPIVGMFYLAPSPDKPPFVQPGDEIDENSVLCVIEAMKVMNEIKAETRGRLREVLVENGQPVEFGQPLFVIDPAE